MRALFVVAILTGSFLLFLVQPMIARMALPRLGGAPAVWNSAMLVYQALLLGGYAYADALGRVRPRIQAVIHVIVLALAALTLPIGVRAMELPQGAQPALWVPWLLAISIGPLFFAVSAQAPLLQRWFAVSSNGRDPYALYSASNVGSFAGLIAYPLLAEPLLTLHAQSLVWTIGYGVLVALVIGCALVLPRHVPGEAHIRHTSPAPGVGRVVHWIALAFVPSGLMLATSTFITTDIVAVPLLWVLPLGLYLLSFTLAFAENRAPALFCEKLAPIAVLMIGPFLISGNQDHPFVNAGLALALLFAVSVALHARMYALRPAPDRLTGFYLVMSFGGALGGVFAGLIAPILFDWTYEFPLLVLAAAPLVRRQYLFTLFARFWRGDASLVRIKLLSLLLGVLLALWLGLSNPGNLLGSRPQNFGFFVIALCGLVLIGRRIPFTCAVAAILLVYGGYQSIQFSLSGARTRSYFGVYTVRDTPLTRVLTHGTTVHGVEVLRSPRAPTTYYYRESGVGQAMQRAPALFGPAARIGVVGLGSGTLACYAQPGQHWRFYEIDPAIERIASTRFQFLPSCLPHADITTGDARLSLAREPGASRDLLVLDAFSSDAVPMHLLTQEAFAEYARVVAPHGLLMVHISNRYLNLAPVVAAAAKAGGWKAALLVFRPDSRQASEQAAGSDWIALTRDPALLADLVRGNGAWRPLEPQPGFTPWGDDFASILPVLNILWGKE